MPNWRVYEMENKTIKWSNTLCYIDKTVSILHIELPKYNKISIWDAKPKSIWGGLL